jgi:hypothetical protein
MVSGFMDVRVIIAIGERMKPDLPLPLIDVMGYSIHIDDGWSDDSLNINIERFSSMCSLFFRNFTACGDVSL